MNILSLPKHYRTSLLNSINCTHKALIPSMSLEKLLNAQKKEGVEEIHFCTSSPEDQDRVCEETLKKAEYIKILKNRIPKIFESFVKYSGDFELSLFIDLCFDDFMREEILKKMFFQENENHYHFPDMNMRLFQFVEHNLSIGLMFLFGTDEDNLTLTVPVEFISALKNIDRSMAGFHDYCKVFANLYGICFYESIVQKWNNDHKNQSLPLNKGKSIVNECGLFSGFFVSDEDVVCNWNVETDVTINAIVESRERHKPYIPTDQEFTEWLNYSNDINENMEEFKTIRNHFKKMSDNPELGDFKAFCLLDDLRIGYHHPTEIIEIYRLQIGFTKISIDETTPIINAIMELNNKAKLWCTYGNAPNSLIAPKRFDLRTDIFKTNDPVTKNAPKVGRNDLCPCGSGLKYKKCCGKTVN